MVECGPGDIELRRYGTKTLTFAGNGGGGGQLGQLFKIVCIATCNPQVRSYANSSRNLKYYCS